MAENKNSSRKEKVEKFKQEAKAKAAQENIPKSHLIPTTEWQSTDVLDIRGDILEALEGKMAEAYEILQQSQQAFSSIAQLVSMIIGYNIRTSKKIALKYVWNNGEDATEAEVKLYEETQAKIQEARKGAADKVAQIENSEKSGLVDSNGSPIGSTTRPVEDNPGSDLVA